MKLFINPTIRHCNNPYNDSDEKKNLYLPFLFMFWRLFIFVTDKVLSKIFQYYSALMVSPLKKISK